MIALDSSSLLAFLAGDEGADVELVDDALSAGTAVLAPAALAELLSDPDLPGDLEADLLRIPLLEVTAGYFERVGRLRRAVLKKKRRARLGDALISQACLDHGVPLVTRDEDFGGYAAVSPLKLL